MVWGPLAETFSRIMLLKRPFKQSQESELERISSLNAALTVPPVALAQKRELYNAEYLCVGCIQWMQPSGLHCNVTAVGTLRHVLD